MFAEQRISPASIDAWLMGSAWVESQLAATLQSLCDDIGPRWAGTAAEQRAADFIRGRFELFGLDAADLEPFDLRTWHADDAVLRTGASDGALVPVRPCLFCPSVQITARLVDVGFGMDHELDRLADPLAGAVALIDAAHEPFTRPRPVVTRLEALASRGVQAAICWSPHYGRRLTLMSASDWREELPVHLPLPAVQAAREDMSLLRRSVSSGEPVTLTVNAQFDTTTSWNSVARLPGARWPDESIVVGAHHDTTPESPGANDNAAGVAVLLEAARLLAGLNQRAAQPGRTIQFVTFGGEEQGLQGSTAYVRAHHGPEPLPRLMLNLDELGVGTMKGVVLQFPDLRPLIQRQLDELGEGLRCHVLDQFDASGDMFPFARAGIPAAMLWRWRFVSRHPDAEYGHCSSDTAEKLRRRELKEYAGNLARLLYRLSHVAPEEWTPNLLDPGVIADQIASQRGSVLRTM